MQRTIDPALLFLGLISAAACAHSSSTSVPRDASETKPFLNFIRAIDPKHILGTDDSMPAPCLNQGVHQYRKNRAKPDSVGWVSFGSNKGISVRCNQGAIVEIRLENSNLSGKIEADSICKLQSLRVLNLAKNSIHGSIPESIIHCKRLTHLNLSFNNLSGKVPLTLLHKLSHLKKLDISNNQFTTITPQFNKKFKYGNSLKSQADGSVSPSSVSPSLGISMSDNGEAHGLHHGWVKWLIAALVAAIFIVFSFFVCKKVSGKFSGKKKQNEKSPQKSPVVDLPATSSKMEEPEREVPELVFFDEEDDRFTLEDLLKATADLRNQNICSSLFKVMLKNKHYAIKTLRKMEISFGEFRTTLQSIGNLKHPNILPLVGYYSANEEKILIYRYQRNGSLQDLLDNSIEGKKIFPWRLRVSIASGIAKGLSFIHQRSNEENSIPHGNLKPSNILLNQNNEPQISEYGITKFLDPKRANLLPSKGYRAPEKKLSEKGDVYSFGVILLELLTGKSVAKSGINLPKWVRAKVREEWTCEVFDEEVAKNAEKWAFSLLIVAVDCVANYPEGRPTMAEAAGKMEEVVRAVEDSERLISPSFSDSGTSSRYQYQ